MISNNLILKQDFRSFEKISKQKKFVFHPLPFYLFPKILIL